MIPQEWAEGLERFLASNPTRGEYAVLAVILLRFLRSGEAPAPQAVQEVTGLGRSVVFEAVRKLVADGVILRDGAGFWMSNGGEPVRPSGLEQSGRPDASPAGRTNPAGRTQPSGRADDSGAKSQPGFPDPSVLLYADKKTPTVPSNGICKSHLRAYSAGTAGDSSNPNGDGDQEPEDPRKAHFFKARRSEFPAAEGWQPHMVHPSPAELAAVKSNDFRFFLPAEMGKPPRTPWYEYRSSLPCWPPVLDIDTAEARADLGDIRLRPHDAPDWRDLPRQERQDLIEVWDDRQEERMTFFASWTPGQAMSYIRGCPPKRELV